MVNHRQNNAGKSSRETFRLHVNPQNVVLVTAFNVVEKLVLQTDVVFDIKTHSTMRVSLPVATNDSVVGDMNDAVRNLLPQPSFRYAR